MKQMLSLKKELRIVFDFLCSKNKEGKESTTYDEIRERVKAVDPSIRIEQLVNLDFKDDLIDSTDDINFILSKKGINKCKEIEL